MLRGERDFPHSGMQAFGRGCFPTFRIDDPARNKRRIAVGFQCFESQRTRNAFDQITSFGEKRDIEIPFGIPLRCLTLVTAAVSRDMHGCTEKIIGSRIAHKSGIGRQGVITAFGGHGQRQITCIDALPLPNPYPQRSGRRLVEGGLFHAPEFDIDVFAQPSGHAKRHRPHGREAKSYLRPCNTVYRYAHTPFPVERPRFGRTNYERPAPRFGKQAEPQYCRQTATGQTEKKGGGGS